MKRSCLGVAAGMSICEAFAPLCALADAESDYSLRYSRARSIDELVLLLSEFSCVDGAPLCLSVCATACEWFDDGLWIWISEHDDAVSVWKHIGYIRSHASRTWRFRDPVNCALVPCVRPAHHHMSYENQDCPRIRINVYEVSAPFDRGSCSLGCRAHVCNFKTPDVILEKKCDSPSI